MSFPTILITPGMWKTVRKYLKISVITKPIAHAAPQSSAMEFARIMDVSMVSFEEKFRAEHPDCSVGEEVISSSLTRYHVVVGNVHCSESAVRELAFKYALEDIKEGRLNLPPRIEQLALWP